MENGNQRVYESALGLETNRGAQKEFNNVEIDLFNQAVEQKTKEYSDKMTNTVRTAEDILNKQEQLEVMPIGAYVLVKPYDTNPYNKITINDSGLVLDAGIDPTFKNPESGETDYMENVMKVGTVLEVGPEVKHIRIGDDVYYKKSNMVPIPFLKQGWIVLHEAGIMVVINENVKSRWTK